MMLRVRSERLAKCSIAIGGGSSRYVSKGDCLGLTFARPGLDKAIRVPTTDPADWFLRFIALEICGHLCFLLLLLGNCKALVDDGDEQLKQDDCRSAGQLSHGLGLSSRPTTCKQKPSTYKDSRYEGLHLSSFELH